jgi:hypothetical protein
VYQIPAPLRLTPRQALGFDTWALTGDPPMRRAFFVKITPPRPIGRAGYYAAALLGNCSALLEIIDADRRLGLSRLFVGAWCWTAPRGRQKCNQLGLVLSQAGDQLRRRPQPSIKLLGRRTRDPPYEGVR